MSAIMERIPAVLAKMIQKCCDIKRMVVERDPKEQGGAGSAEPGPYGGTCN